MIDTSTTYQGPDKNNVENEQEEVAEATQPTQVESTPVETTPTPEPTPEPAPQPEPTPTETVVQEADKVEDEAEGEVSKYVAKVTSANGWWQEVRVEAKNVEEAIVKAKDEYKRLVGVIATKVDSITKA